MQSVFGARRHIDALKFGISSSITNFGTPQAPAYAGVVNIFLLTLFIMAFAPDSGGLFNQSGFGSLEN